MKIKIYLFVLLLFGIVNISNANYDCETSSEKIIGSLSSYGSCTASSYGTWSNGSRLVYGNAANIYNYTIPHCRENEDADVGTTAINESCSYYEYDYTPPKLSATDTDNLWNSGPINIRLNTEDLSGSGGVKSGLKYSKYSWDTSCSETVGVDYTNGQTITYDTEGRHTLYLCNGDNAGNKNTWTSGIYLIDKTNPKTTLNSIVNNKKAGENNISINEKIYDDAGKTDTTSLYGYNYKVSYNLSIKGPHQAGYNGKVINENSIDIKETGNILNNQTLNKNFSLTLVGKYDVSIKLTDKSGRVYNENKTITIYPADLDQTNTTISVDSNGDKFANNSDYYKYTLILKDIYGNAIYGKNTSLVIKDTSSLKTVDGTNGLMIKKNPTTTNAEGKTSFSIKSLVPGQFNQIFDVKMNQWGDNYANLTTSKTITKSVGINSFKKPVTSTLEISNDGGTNWNAKPEINKLQKYRIKLNNVGGLSSSPTIRVFGHSIANPVYYSNGSLNLQKSFFIVDGGQWLGNFANIYSSFGSNLSTNLGFEGKFDLNTGILSATTIRTNNLPIEYTIGGKRVSYNLTDSSVIGCSKSTLGVKIEGTIQGNGKSSLTGQKSNFSDLSKAELRASIRKNAYLLTKGMTSGQILNGVKYVEGDTISISGDQDYETLVVKNGNVFISGNLNPSKKKLGIIVLKDNYNTSNDYNNIGNIYVSNIVSNINVIIYADGTFRSADSNGASYSDSQLSNKIDLYGSLFTRNTIGGAVKAGSNYTLPGGSVTTDQSLAEVYDLNYVRKTTICNPNDYSFKITYNPTIQTNPPKGFAK